MIVGGEIPKEKRLKRARKDESQIPDITFRPEDGQHVQHPHNDALVVSAHIQNFLVKRLSIDDGSAVNALSWEAYKAMGGLRPSKVLLQAFVVARPNLWE